ncbi:MAG: glycine zipper family protein [Candidatus Rokuibacteriota bacterium]
MSARTRAVRSGVMALTAVTLLSACVTIPSGPSVMVLPGDGKNFDQFQMDDGACRQWAMQQTGTTAQQASNDSGVASAAIGTVVGAALGAAIGAAAGNPAMGAAVGAGAGLFGGTMAGANNAYASAGMVQRRYDHAYMQCMYAKGNQIPFSGRARPSYAPPAAAPSQPPPAAVPPPPVGPPPPPPPGAALPLRSS